MDEQRLCLGVVNKQDASFSLWQGFGQCRGWPRPRPTPPHPLAKFFFVPRFPQLRPLPLGLSPQAGLLEPEAARRGRGRQTADQHEVSCSPGLLLGWGRGSLGHHCSSLQLEAVLQ